MIAMKTLLLMVMGLAGCENGGYCVDCIIGSFWIRYLFLFIGCYKAAQETGAKFVPQTLPQCNSTKHRPSFPLNFKMYDGRI